MRKLVFVATTAAALGAAGVALGAALPVIAQALTPYSAQSTVPAATCTLVASADTFVDQAQAGSSFGTAATMRIQDRNGAHRRSFARFDVASCVPAGALVVSASLRARLSTAPRATRTYEARRATSAWSESSLSWSTQPAAAATSATASTGTTDGVTLEWAVTDDVQRFADGTANNGWRIADQAEGANSRREGAFDTRESATPPTLTITYYP